MPEKVSAKLDDWRYRQSRRQDLVHIFIFLLILVVFHVLLVQVRSSKKGGEGTVWNILIHEPMHCHVQLTSKEFTVNQQIVVRREEKLRREVKEEKESVGGKRRPLLPNGEGRGGLGNEPDVVHVTQAHTGIGQTQDSTARVERKPVGNGCTNRPAPDLPSNQRPPNLRGDGGTFEEKFINRSN